MAKKPRSLLDEFMDGPDDDANTSGFAGWWQRCKASDPERFDELVILIDAWIADIHCRGPRKKAKSMEKFRLKLAPIITEMIGEVPGPSAFREFFQRRKESHGKA